MDSDRSDPVAPLPASALRKTCDVTELGFTSTSELDPVDDLIGQERALSSLALGTNMRQDGFNAFALGPARSGRHGAIRRLLERRAAAEAIPDDWVCRSRTSPEISKVAPKPEII